MAAVGGLERDLVQPFLLEQASVRGRFVRLCETVRYVLGAHPYPPLVARQLGELLVLAATFVGALKFQGTFSLQVRGDGPLSLLVADVTNEGTMRGYAAFNADRLSALEEDAPSGRLFGTGVLALTVDQRGIGGGIHQGVVRLDGESLAEAVGTYFRQSEQLPTAIRVANGRDPLDGGWRAAGLILQAMPGEGSTDPEERREHWRRVVMLLATASEAELLGDQLGVEQVLFRLFHQEGVRLFPPATVRPGCSCEKARVLELLRGFPREELAAMRLEDGAIEAVCEFCGRRYRLGAEEVEGLLRRAKDTGVRDPVR